VLYDWMTVAEIGWFAAGFHLDSQGTTSGYQYRYTELMRGFDLPARKKIKVLSKGMRAKVSLSLALASDPSLLILDEPTSGLDVLVRRDFLSKHRALRKFTSVICGLAAPSQRHRWRCMWHEHQRTLQQGNRPCRKHGRAGCTGAGEAPALLDHTYGPFES
jgi:ABC-type transport system involved in cytochrome c biogenesis ATPase subunit